MMMMMSCRGGGAESHQNNNVREKSFRIRHDDLKLFSRFLSRQETSNNHSSFRVYYGDVSSVPFVWESQPGTPKHRFADGDGAALRPPLTPPPSYYCNSGMAAAAGAPARKKKVLPGSILLRAFLTKVSLRRTKSTAAAAAVPSPAPSLSLSPSFSSSSSSSLSSFSATPSSFRGRRARRFSGSSFDKGIEDIAKAEPSAACCGIIHMERSIVVKKFLSSIVGRRQNLN